MAELKRGSVSTMHHHVMRESFSVETKLKLRWRRMWGSQPRRGAEGRALGRVAEGRRSRCRTAGLADEAGAVPKRL